MADQPLVSVIIPAYQAEQTVGAAVSSALCQTYPEVEVVVCNDGSTDRTQEICESYGDRVRVICQENSGVSTARNTAVAHATGRYLAPLDADDFWFPNYLDAAFDALRSAPGERNLVTSNAYFLTPTGVHPQRKLLEGAYPVPRGEQRKRILERNFVGIFSVFPREMWDEAGELDPQLETLEDYDLWARAIFGGWRVAFQMTPTALYRRSATSLTAQREKLHRSERVLLGKLNERFHHGLSESERDILARRMDSEPPGFYVDEGERALDAGDLRAAAAAFATASQLLPSDRGLRRKAAVLKRVPSPAAKVLQEVQRRRRLET